MKLDFIPLDRLSISKSNMRYGKRAPDVADLLPTVRKRGVLQPVIVRPNCAPDSYEIVAGARRFTAACLVAEERRSGRGVPFDVAPRIRRAAEAEATVSAKGDSEPDHAQRGRPRGGIREGAGRHPGDRVPDGP